MSEIYGYVRNGPDIGGGQDVAWMGIGMGMERGWQIGEMRALEKGCAMLELDLVRTSESAGTRCSQTGVGGGERGRARLP